MKIKLYYSVDIGYENDWLTGNKTVYVYEVKDSDLILWFELYLLLEENTKDCINDYLDKNGYSGAGFELVWI